MTSLDAEYSFVLSVCRHKMFNGKDLLHKNERNTEGDICVICYAIRVVL
jgi:hypothetical protein